MGTVPSVYACYRFAAKLRVYSDLLSACVGRVLSSLQTERPELGRDLCVDASDLPAFANGQRFVSRHGRERGPEEYSDPDASWGRRSAVSTRKGGGYYGFKIHAAVCSITGLPVAWQVETARQHEATMALPLIDAARARGFAVETCAMDKGYDVRAIYDGCEARGVRPIIPLRMTPAVARGDSRPPTCEHGQWRFAGSDFGRGASNWRCPTGGCIPASRWVKGGPPSPADPARDAALAQALPWPRRCRARVRTAQA